MKALLATRKGLIILKPQSTGWAIDRVHFDGVKVTYVAQDPQAGWIWAGVNHGHWGPKLHVSKDKGKTFQELTTPKFPAGSKDSLREFWAVTRDSHGRIYVGVDPAAVFHSDDDGKTWHLNRALAKVKGRDKWFAGGTDGACVHSIVIPPQDPERIVIGISVGGVLESTNRGKSWQSINSGLQANFMPNPEDPVVQDPHKIQMAPSNPNILWQQNHCGIFKSDNQGRQWQNLSQGKGLKSSFGWAVVIDEKDADTAWTIPAVSDETRVPVQKKLIVQKTTNGGKSWKVISKGLPQKFCYDIIMRHAFAKIDKHMLFASTTGHVYFSKNTGESWKQLPYQLAPVYSVELFNL